MARAPEICQKDPDEVRIFSFDFTNELNDGATITSIIGIVATPTGLTLTNPTVVSDALVSVRVADGTHGDDHHIEATVLTSDFEEIELAGKLQIRNSYREEEEEA